MTSDHLVTKVETIIETLCSVVPNRRTGSPGNREATDFFAEVIRAYGYDVDTTPFECLDHVKGESSLTQTHGREAFEVRISPYSLGCDVEATLVVASTMEELEAVGLAGKILLMRGPLCAEQLVPKNFVFYNSERHQHIIALLENRRPAGIVTATGVNPEQAGALDPFPLIVDGDFDVPSVFCKESVGERLVGMDGERFRLQVDARRLPSWATNVIARRNLTGAQKIVVTAHIDAYEDSPGALDNASGTAVLLLLAEMLSDYGGDCGIEIAALNGEDHYSAAGQMDYLNRYGDELDRVVLAVNVDGVGYERGGSAYSFYGCSSEIEARSREVFDAFDGLVGGEPWFSGDHMIFVQAEVPSIAITSELTGEMMRTVTHTALDRPEIVEARKLVEVAHTLDVLIDYFTRRDDGYEPGWGGQRRRFEARG
jgi:aminopeptidase YwaD